MNRTPQIAALIVRGEYDKPHGGARKLRDLLLRRLPGDVKMTACSTIHAVLDRHGLVSWMGRRRNPAQGTPLSAGNQPKHSGVPIPRANSGSATAAIASRSPSETMRRDASRYRNGPTARYRGHPAE